MPENNQPSNGNSTNVQQTFNHKETDTDTETETETETEKRQKTGFSLLCPERDFLLKFSNLHPELIEDLSRDPLSEHVIELLKITKRMRAQMFGKVAGFQAIETAMANLGESEWHVNNGYWSIYWLLDVANRGRASPSLINKWLYKSQDENGNHKNMHPETVEIETGLNYGKRKNQNPIPTSCN